MTPTRSMIFALGRRLLALAALSAGAAEPTSNRVLVVNSDTSVAKYLEVQLAFREGLGTQPTIEVDLTQSSEAQLRRIIAAENPRAIYCIGASAYQAAARIARDRPIVLSSAINWERLNPGRQTRVIANELPSVTQLTLFRHLFPKLQRVGVVYNRDINRQWFDQAVIAGREVGIEVIGRTVSRSGQVAGALNDLAPRVDALWLTPDPIVLENEAGVRRYFAGAAAAKKAVFAYSPAYLDFGAALILAPDMPTIGRQAASLVQDLQNAQPVNTPAGSEVILNLRRVEQSGLTLNPEAMDSVNHLVR
jgi:putative tryptophan/tyrosine transport system substrate-binding protein